MRGISASLPDYPKSRRHDHITGADFVRRN
nr:MAG TPA: hypothetical protein [Caudoviricetes sp.]